MCTMIYWSWVLYIEYKLVYRFIGDDLMRQICRMLIEGKDDIERK